MRRRSLLKGAFAGGLGLATAAVIGCDDDDDDDDDALSTPTATPGGAGGASPTPSGGGGTSPTPTPTVNLADLPEDELFAALPEGIPKDWTDADIQLGGSLIRLSNRTHPTLDPMATVTGGTSDLTTPVYNGLLRLPTRQGFDNIYTPRVEGNLATEWEQPDPTTVVFTLAPGIKWQNVPPLNGRDFVVDDIRYSFERGATWEQSAQAGNYRDIEGVEDAGDGRVRVSLKRPNAAILLQLAAWTTMIVPPEIGEDPDIAATTAVGTGGFILDHITPNVEAVFVKNPDYFKRDSSGNQMPYLDGYTVTYVTDRAQWGALFESKRVDFWGQSADPNTAGLKGFYDFVQRNPDVDYQKLSSVNGTFAHVPHYGKPPFNDVRVRRAYSMGYDRASIIESLYLGQASALPYFPWPAALDAAPRLEDMGPWYKYDPAEAKKLLAAAGHPNGLKVEVQWYQSRDTAENAQLIQQSAAPAGFEITLVKAADLAAQVASYLSKDWKDIIALGRGLDFIDANSVMPYYTPLGSPNNYGEYDDPELSALFDEQAVLLDPDERREVNRQIWDRLLDQMYETIHPNPDGLYYQHRTVANWLRMPWNNNAGPGSNSMDNVWRRG